MNREPLKALINVTQLLREPVGSGQSYDVSGILGDEMEGSVEGTAKMVRITRGVLVQCELNTQVKLICSRCLDVFLCPISFSAEEEFVPISDLSGDLATSSAGRSEEFTIDDKNMIDLGELIRQYVLLNLPMKALCRPDCPGIREENSNAATT